MSLDAFPTVLDLVRNPFVLRLFVEALPGLNEDVQRHLTRHIIYNVFVTQWFAREIARLSLGDKQALGLVDATGASLLSIDDVVSRFDLLAALLAGEMLKANTLRVQPSGNGLAAGESDRKVWCHYRDMAADWLLRDVVAAAQLGSAGRSLFDQHAAAAAATVAAIAAVEKLQVTCPLRRIGSSLEFIHKSFQEYFCARLILLGAGANVPLDVRVQRTVQALSIPGRRIQAEPEVLHLLADHWHHTFAEVSDVGRARECLFAVVAASARGTGIEGGASANAVTILNWMGEPMLRQPWSGVVLTGADLTRAVLCGTALVGATLTGCRLEKAVLTDAC